MNKKGITILESAILVILLVITVILISQRRNWIRTEYVLEEILRD